MTADPSGNDDHVHCGVGSIAVPDARVDIADIPWSYR
jgi:hypothetical protein